MSRPSWLTNIVVFPLFANVLGLLSIFASAGGMALPLTLADSLPRDFPRGVLVIPGFLTPVAIGAFDLWWRLQQDEPDRRRKLLYPVYSGVIFMIPLWLLYWGGMLFMLVLILYLLIQKLLV